MAVVCETNAGWLLDELSLIKGWYEVGVGPPTCEGQENTRTVYRMKDELFQLVRPYFSLNPSATSNQNTAAPSNRQDDAAPAAACKPVRKVLGRETGGLLTTESAACL